MAIQFVCPYCGQPFKVADQLAGREVGCSGCGNSLTIPDATSSAGEPEPELELESVPEPKVDPPLKHKSRELMPQDLVDMTAMVDIVFFLLIFFLVTSMQGVASTIGMPPTNAQKSATQGKRSLADFGDYLQVRIDSDNAVWIEGDKLLSDQEIRVRLRSARQGDSGPSKMLVMASGEAQHGMVVTVLDAGYDAKMEVRLAVGEEN